ALHRSELKPDQVVVLRWHAGQMDAFAGDSAAARPEFVGSVNPEEPADSPVLWNDYVFASVAFLDRDRETLLAHRNRIARGPVFNGKKPNLEVVDHLLEYFNRP